jgi:hypothetical protein
MSKNKHLTMGETERGEEEREKRTISHVCISLMSEN